MEGEVGAAFHVLAELVAGQLVQGEGLPDEGAGDALAHSEAEVFARVRLGR